MTKFFKRLKNTSPEILIVGFITLFTAVSTTAVYAITPFFLKDTLGISLVAIGLIESTTEAISQLARLVAGVVSDKLKKCKPMFLLGTFLSFLAKPVIIFATGSWTVFLSKVLDRLGNGFSATPRDSYVALNSKPGGKGSNIGLIMTFKTVGCVIGPFIVMACVGLFKNLNWRVMFCFTALFALFSVFLCQKYMKDKDSEEGANCEVKKDNSFKYPDLKNLSKSFWFFLVIMFFFMLGRAPEGYLVLSLRDAGLPEWFCAGAIGFFNFVSVFISYPAGRLSDKYGRTNILFFSFLALFFSVFCLTVQKPLFGVLAVFFWGVQRTSSQIISVAYVADIVDKKNNWDGDRAFQYCDWGV